MSTQGESEYFRCEDCGYHGPSRVSGAAAFMVMIGMLILSAWFLPFIILALGFMIWIISKPAKRYCPGCKSGNLEQITTEEMVAYQKEKKNAVETGTKA